jgi:NAD-dependent dihydropyrimidine dehydrogenase PreA subunit
LQKYFDNITLKSIPRELENNSFDADDESVGFVFPNYFGKLPGIVEKFIYKLNLEKTRYLFAVVSGGGGSGYTYKYLNRIIKSKNKILNAFCETVMPGNYIIAPIYYEYSNRDEEGKKALYKDTGIKIAELSAFISKKQMYLSKMSGITKVIGGILNLSNNLSDTEKWDRNFFTDKNCNFCKTCSRLCPVNNIKFHKDKPLWNHNCQLCMSCINNCPKQAIQYKNITQNRLRYRHPDICIDELLLRN